MPVQVLTAALTDDEFHRPSEELACAWARAGRRAHLYRFDWQSPAWDGLLGACHAIELPFFFANLDAWPDALMLRGVDRDRLRPLARAYGSALAAFVRSGEPGGAGLPQWEPCTPEHPVRMLFE